MSSSKKSHENRLSNKKKLVFLITGEEGLRGLQGFPGLKGKAKE